MDVEGELGEARETATFPLSFQTTILIVHHVIDGHPLLWYLQFVSPRANAFIAKRKFQRGDARVKCERLNLNPRPDDQNAVLAIVFNGR